MYDNLVHVINLKHRPDRLEHFKQQAKEQGFEYKVWPGIIHELPFTGIAKAFKQVVQYAKDNNLDRVIIAEDDVCFSCHGAFNYFIENTPDDFDLYLSSVYAGDLTKENTVTWFSGFTLCIIHSRFYDKFLATPENNHIDRQMKIHEGIYKVCSPFIAKQIDGYSDNSHQVTNYNKKYLADKKFLTYQGQQT